MKRFRFLLATSLIAGGTATANQLHADDDETPKRDPVSRMLNLDKDDDGKISKSELPERLASMFARADKNEDGVLDQAEIRAAFADRTGSGTSDRRRAEGRPDGDRGPRIDGREGMRRPGPDGEGRGDRDGDRRPERNEGDRGMERSDRRLDSPPESPLMAAIDRNRDGKISESEITNAVKALKALDRNEDGTIDAEELRMRRRPDGPPRRDQQFGDRAPEGRRGDDRGPAPGFQDRMRERFGARGPGGGGPGSRGPGGGPPGPEAFVKMMLERMDQNNDGKLSGDEIPERMAARLKQIDKNADGVLDKAELQAMAQQMGRGRGPGADRGRGGPEGGRGRRGGPKDGESGRDSRPDEAPAQAK